LYGPPIPHRRQASQQARETASGPDGQQASERASKQERILKPQQPQKASTEISKNRQITNTTTQNTSTPKTH
jgi:hypothetical protein